MLSYQQWGNEHSQQQVLFIHGWGMNSGVWTDMAEYLLQIHPERLICAVDLPGYGRSSINELSGESYNSQSLAKSLEPILAGKQTTIVAWSMGGLVAIELLSHLLQKKALLTDAVEINDQTKVTQLLLVASTPRFVQAEDWPHAVEAYVFEEFSQSLVSDHRATLRRFLMIQAMGSRTARDDIKTLQAQLFLRGEPDEIALKYGLEMLLNEDKRLQLCEMTEIPVYLIAGKKDTLARYKGQEELAGQKNISLFTIPCAGHAPFISHPDEFKKILEKVI